MTNQPVSDEKARQILGRAAEIDRKAGESISIETLRAAAHEAGISPSSFDAALAEQDAAAVASPATTVSRRQVLGAAVGVLGGVLLLFGALRMVAIKAPPVEAAAPHRDTPITRAR